MLCSRVFAIATFVFPGPTRLSDAVLVVRANVDGKLLRPRHENIASHACSKSASLHRCRTGDKRIGT